MVSLMRIGSTVLKTMVCAHVDDDYDADADAADGGGGGLEEEDGLVGSKLVGSSSSSSSSSSSDIGSGVGNGNVRYLSMSWMGAI